MQLRRTLDSILLGVFLYTILVPLTYAELYQDGFTADTVLPIFISQIPLVSLLLWWRIRTTGEMRLKKLHNQIKSLRTNLQGQCERLKQNRAAIVEVLSVDENNKDYLNLFAHSGLLRSIITDAEDSILILENQLKQASKHTEIFRISRRLHDGQNLIEEIQQHLLEIETKVNMNLKLAMAKERLSSPYVQLAPLISRDSVSEENSGVNPNQLRNST